MEDGEVRVREGGRGRDGVCAVKSKEEGLQQSRSMIGEDGSIFDRPGRKRMPACGHSFPDPILV